MLYSGKKFRQIRSECVTVALSYETESPYTACDRQNVAHWQDISRLKNGRQRDKTQMSIVHSSLTCKPHNLCSFNVANKPLALHVSFVSFDLREFQSVSPWSLFTEFWLL